MIFFIVQAAVIAVLVSMLLPGREKNSMSAENLEEKKIPVSVYEVRAHRMENVAEFPGIVESWTTIRISAEVSGRIVFIGASKGDKVAKDQVLMRIDDSTYAAEKKKCEANLKFARQNIERMNRLYSAKSISEKELEDACNMLGEKEAEFQIASTDLERCEIRSPDEGYLESKPVEVGEFVQPGTQVATIEQVDFVTLAFSIPEKDIPLARKGEEMSFTLDCIPGRTFTGKMSYLAKIADMESLSFRAELDVDNRELVLRPGMIARVKFNKGAVENMPVIPLIAVIPRYEGHYVFVVDKDGRARLREIKLGLICDRNAVVASGLEFGDLVVVEGQRLLNEKDPLQITERKTDL